MTAGTCAPAPMMLAATYCLDMDPGVEGERLVAPNAANRAYERRSPSVIEYQLSVLPRCDLANSEVIFATFSG
jgi:hypothetical protein